jgi:hypothetical protein
VYCQKKPQGTYWHTDKAEMLGKIETDLFEAAAQFGNG